MPPIPPEPSKPSCMAKNGQKRPKTAKNSKIGHFPLLSGRLRRLKIDFWSKSCLDHQYTPEIYQQQKIWAKPAQNRAKKCKYTYFLNKYTCFGHFPLLLGVHREAKNRFFFKCVFVGSKYPLDLPLTENLGTNGQNPMKKG